MHRDYQAAALCNTCSAENNDVTYENYEKKRSSERTAPFVDFESL